MHLRVVAKMQVLITSDPTHMKVSSRRLKARKLGRVMSRQHLFRLQGLQIRCMPRNQVPYLKAIHL